MTAISELHLDEENATVGERLLHECIALAKSKFAWETAMMNGFRVKRLSKLAAQLARTELGMAGGFSAAELPHAVEEFEKVREVIPDEPRFRGINEALRAAFIRLLTIKAERTRAGTLADPD